MTVSTLIKFLVYAGKKLQIPQGKTLVTILINYEIWMDLASIIRKLFLNKLLTTLKYLIKNAVSKMSCMERTDNF